VNNIEGSYSYILNRQKNYTSKKFIYQKQATDLKYTYHEEFFTKPLLKDHSALFKIVYFIFT